MIQNIKINGKKYTLKEARSLYEDLHELFGPKYNYSYPWYYYGITSTTSGTITLPLDKEVDTSA